MKSAEITKKIPLELLCIQLLEERDMYGYEIKKTQHRAARIEYYHAVSGPKAAE